MSISLNIKSNKLNLDARHSSLIFLFIWYIFKGKNLNTIYKAKLEHRRQRKKKRVI